MDKYEYKVKLAQIEKLIAKKDFVTAAKIADGIDWRKVKSSATLYMVADIYEENQRFEDCYEILNMIYDRSPNVRRVVYRMAEVAIKMHDFEEAIDLYKEFVKISPHDLSKYILKYQIYRERGSSVRDQISILEEYKNHEYDEKWAYELACLYEEAGMLEQCIEECDELILWFSEGEYVAKAMELKLKYRELSASQKEKYEHRYDYLMEKEQQAEDSEEEEKEKSEPENSKQRKSDEKTGAESIEEAGEPEQNIQVEEITSEEKETSEGEVFGDTPNIPVINVNKFSTMNLQEELAKGLQQILAMVEEETQKQEEISAEEETQKIEKLVAEEAQKIAKTLVAEKTQRIEKVSVKEEPQETEEEKVVKEEAALPDKNTEAALSETAEIRTELLKYMQEPQEPSMDEMFCIDDDGQVSLAIGNEDVLEKQITGQITIEDILEAWEEKKRQAKEKSGGSVERKEPVLFETGEITELLKDFIPRTPKSVFEEEGVVETKEGEVKEEAEAIPEGDLEAALEAEFEVRSEPQLETQPEVKSELQPEVQSESQPETDILENIEDDLPIDLNFVEALEAALKESESGPDQTGEINLGAIKLQNTASMLDAIEKALAQDTIPSNPSAAYLTEEQEKIFSYFSLVEDVKNQLAKLMWEHTEYVDGTDSNEGNLVITGHPGSGKTTLAINIVKAFQKQKNVKGGKLAKVTSDGLNKKDPEEVVKKLGGGALIIERAGCLRNEIVEQLSEIMERDTGGFLLILEDDASEITRLFKNHERFAKKFSHAINIPIFSNDELVSFGKSYAEEQEYYLDEMAVLALYDCIGVKQTSDHVVNVTEVKGFIDDAIEHAEKKSRGLFARLSRKRVDEEGNRLLLEEDFD